MGLNNLKPAKGSTSNRKRIGRGNATGQGRTAGKGHNGYKSRSGTKAKLHFEGGQTPMARRLPKRGMGRGKFNHLSTHKKDIQILNITDLVKLSVKDIDKNILKENGLINYIKLPVKILGNGNINSIINVKVDSFSDSAKDKIEKAGGKAQRI
jgi:large subunit ribosomal protein L15